MPAPRVWLRVRQRHEPPEWHVQFAQPPAQHNESVEGAPDARPQQGRAPTPLAPRHAVSADPPTRSIAMVMGVRARQGEGQMCVHLLSASAYLPPPLPVRECMPCCRQARSTSVSEARALA